MRAIFQLLSGILLSALLLGADASAFESENYLYYRDANVPQFQTSREFFDMPNRPGKYEVNMVSDAIGPLTFRVVRVFGDHEQTERQSRSYKVGAHEFQTRFTIPDGENDLIVEISNSNPAQVAKVAVIVVELPSK